MGHILIYFLNWIQNTAQGPQTKTGVMLLGFFLLEPGDRINLQAPVFCCGYAKGRVQCHVIMAILSTCHKNHFINFLISCITMNCHKLFMFILRLCGAYKQLWFYWHVLNAFEKSYDTKLQHWKKIGKYRILINLMSNYYAGSNFPKLSWNTYEVMKVSSKSKMDRMEPN